MGRLDHKKENSMHFLHWAYRLFKRLPVFACNYDDMLTFAVKNYTFSISTREPWIELLTAHWIYLARNSLLPAIYAQWKVQCVHGIKMKQRKKNTYTQQQQQQRNEFKFNSSSRSVIYLLGLCWCSIFCGEFVANILRSMRTTIRRRIHSIRMIWHSALHWLRLCAFTINLHVENALQNDMHNINDSRWIALLVLTLTIGPWSCRLW